MSNPTAAPDSNFCAETLVKLSNGITAYKLVAPINGADPKMTIVCLHGFNTSSWMWSDLAEIYTDELCGPGAQVLVFDFYGHGRSPWTGVVQCTLNILVSQTLELLDILNFKEPVSVVGHCMGGAVAVGFAAKYPDRCSSLCIFGSLGLYSNRSLSDRMLKIPCIGDLLMLQRKPKLVFEQEKEFFNILEDTDHRMLINRQMAMVNWQLNNTPGYLSAVLSRYRSFPVQGMGELYDLVGRHPNRPVLIIWGDHDAITPFDRVRGELEESFPNGTITLMENCGHNALFEQFYQFATYTVDFHTDLLDLSKGRSVSLRVADRNYSKNMNEYSKPANK
mmetsp:Transcript_17082/g.17151  ORF Transcript_17082/g.17151 Transcript_17082/m.17151 type:complete len:335 (+) Transcript_17082:130-1134(+)